tara:strand:+ start:136 stop:249 length:114 start_codon:yes stop_codon:yes gene_type:complete
MDKTEVIKLIEEKLQEVEYPKNNYYIIDEKIWTTTIA